MRGATRWSNAWPSGCATRRRCAASRTSTRRCSRPGRTAACTASARTHAAPASGSRRPCACSARPAARRRRARLVRHDTTERRMALRLAMAQFDFPVGAVASNAERIAEMIAIARDEHGADVVLFPELAISGYPPEDLLLRPRFLAECEAAIQRIAEGVHGIVAVVGWPQAAGAVVYNAASVLRDGVIEATYRKRELPNYAVFDERCYFAADDGTCVFEVAGTQVGLVICEGLWIAAPAVATARAGAQLLLVPNASPFERGKSAQRDALLAQRASDSGLAIAYLNVVGGQ